MATIMCYRGDCAWAGGMAMTDINYGCILQGQRYIYCCCWEPIVLSDSLFFFFFFRKGLIG